MLSIERVKELLEDPNMSDEETTEIRDGFYLLVEIIFEKWQVEQQERSAKKNNDLYEIN